MNVTKFNTRRYNPVLYRLLSVKERCQLATRNRSSFYLYTWFVFNLDVEIQSRETIVNWKSLRIKRYNRLCMFTHDLPRNVPYLLQCAPPYKHDQMIEPIVYSYWLLVQFTLMYGDIMICEAQFPFIIFSCFAQPKNYECNQCNDRSTAPWWWWW